MERQQVQPRATRQETVEADRTRTDFKDMGTMRNRTVELVRWWKTLDRLWRRRMSECWQLKFNAKTVIDTRALISGERRGDSPHHELSGLYLISSPPSSHPLRQLLYSRLRLCVLRAQMSLLDESTRHHRNSRHAGVHYKHIP